MQPIPPDRILPFAPAFFPAGPGPMVGRHVLNTGCGEILVDRFPDPRLIFSRAGGNLALAGDPDVATVPKLQVMIQDGMLEAGAEFGPRLRQAFSRVLVWERLIYVQESHPVVRETKGFILRRVRGSDSPAVVGISPDLRWIWNTWGDAAALAGSGCAWGAFRDGRPVALACSFFVGDDYEDIGVITEPGFRGLGLSSSCTTMLSLDIRARGRTACWSTSKPNIASRRVAEKSGFALARESFLFVINGEIPD